MSKKLTIGILAHVDAGKTSLTESLLYTAGAIAKRGSVDKGSAITDGLDMEKSRGISIKSATVDFDWKETKITLVDTPGHMDFAAEVDRALSILDMAILVVSAVEGIQAHTLNLWESLRERKLPVIVFINKMDRAGADLEQVVSDFEKELNTRLFAFNFASNSDLENPFCLPFVESGPHLASAIPTRSLENLAELDEAFLEAYLDGTPLDLEEVKEKAQRFMKSKQLFPVLMGSAKLDLGIDHLLESLSSEIFARPNLYDKPAAKIFKVSYDEKLGRLAHFRSYGSELKSKDVLWSQQLEKEIKINQLFRNHLGAIEQVKTLESGEIGLLSASDLLLAGDVLGEEKLGENYTSIGQTVLSVEALAEEEKDYQKLGEALELLHIEDPTLDFRWYKEEREFHLKILGPIQTEVLEDALRTRFGIAATFKKPQVIYKETPSQAAEGYVRYWMPKPCWAILRFAIEPGPLGSGVKFESKVRTSDISNKYQNEVKRAIPWALKQGIKGWEVSDLKITLVEGSEHTVHSNPGDFLLATPMGILRGLEQAGTDLLEPMYAFQIKAPEDTVGVILSDLNQMKAEVDAPVFEGNNFTLLGRVAVAQAMDYSIAFNAATSGKGRVKLTLDGYQKTSYSKEKTRTFKGVSPLDEAQWILHKRGAFRAEA